MSLMYKVNGKTVRTWNPFVGCKYDCIYCYAPPIYKRFSKCEKCKKFTPHFHEERLKQKFKAGETWFVCSMGDISFASFDQFADILAVTSNYPKTTFYIQSKNPTYFSEYLRRYSGDIRSNIVLGTTIESNYYHFLSCGSIRGISKAPHPAVRKEAMVKYLTESRKYAIIEPVLEFNVPIMVGWIKEIAPEFVYVGYLNPESKAKKLQLQEPSLEKTRELCEELRKFTEVRLKTMRKAWQEDEE